MATASGQAPEFETVAARMAHRWARFLQWIGPRGEAVPPVNALAAVDAWLERVYQRSGWRLFWYWVWFVYGLAAILCFAVAGPLAYRLHPSGEDAAWFYGLLVLMVPAGVWPMQRYLARLLRQTRAAPPAETWVRLQRLPREVTRAYAIFQVGYVFPAGTLVLVRFGGGDAVTTLLVVPVLLTPMVALLGILTNFAGQVALRPIQRDVTERLDVVPAPVPTSPIRLRLLFAVAVLSLSMIQFGVLYGAQPGIDSLSLLRRLLLASAVAIIAFVPIGLIFALAVPQALGDLLAATQRLRDGDFTTPIPVISSDEHGLLARSFNDAMDGLQRGRALAADNERLLGEVHSSRARIVSASDSERRRVERNLHDGAQQQLVAVALCLRLLEEQTGDPATAAGLQKAGADLRAALDDLRELGRGLHPAVLSTDGLGPALEQLICRAPVPVSIEATDERFDAAIESTVYFVAAEALANVAKYANASRAAIRVQRRDGFLLAEVCDDGIGGALPRDTSGLAGLVDRVAALGGMLTVVSPPGGGTRVSAELPIGIP